jgi:type VII secretion integral membrane protein EccD
VTTATAQATRYVRTSIVMRDCTVDVQLPADTPVEDVVFELIRYLNSELVRQGRDASWLRDIDARWSLERFGRGQMDEDSSLWEQGVRDGSRLWLVKDARNEKYPALIDDSAESVADYQEEFPDWRYEVDGVRFAIATLGMIAGFIALAATYFVGWAEPDNTALRYPVVAALGLIAILGVAVAGVVDKSKNTALTSCLVISGYMCAASAAFLSIPRQPGMWHVATTGAVVLVYGAVAAAVSKSAATVHAAAIVIALVPTVVLVINAFYLSPPAVIAAQVGTLALLVVLASRLPLGLASVAPPYVPAPGEPLAPNETSISDVNRGSSSREVIESVINQKPQNELAHRYQTGILFGASLLMVVSAFISGFTVDNTKWGVFVFWVGVAVSVMNRSRNYVDRTAHIILLTASGLIMFGYISSLMLSHPYGNSEQILAAVLVTVFIALIGSLWAIGQKKLFSPTRRFHFEIVERIFYAVPVIVLGIWLMEAYTKVRNR